MDSRTAANEVIKRLRNEGFDAFRKGSYHDISDRVWEKIVSVLDETQSRERAVLQAAIAYRHTVDLNMDLAAESNRKKLLAEVDALIAPSKTT